MEFKIALRVEFMLRKKESISKIGVRGVEKFFTAKWKYRHSIKFII